MAIEKPFIQQLFIHQLQYFLHCAIILKLGDKHKNKSNKNCNKAR